MKNLFTAFIEHKEFKKSRPWSVTKQVFDTAIISTPHYAETVEILLCCGISGYAYIGGRKFDMSGEKVLFVPPQAVHSFDYRPSDGYLLVVKLHPSLLKEFVNIDALLAEYGTSLDILENEYFVCKELVEKANRLSEENDFSDSLCAIISIISLLAKKTSENRSRDEKISVSSGIINEIIAWTEQNYMKNISLDEVSKRFGYTKSYFCDMFRSRTGITYLKYLNNMRISSACAMLKKGIAVNRVSQLCGFETDSYFIQLFKKTIGITPKQYQKGI